MGRHGMQRQQHVSVERLNRDFGHRRAANGNVCPDRHKLLIRTLRHEHLLQQHLFGPQQPVRPDFQTHTSGNVAYGAERPNIRGMPNKKFQMSNSGKQLSNVE
jgi:hypothetical protein